MIRINWNPLPHLGPVPINWYGLNWILAFVVGFLLVRRWSGQWPALRSAAEPKRKSGENWNGNWGSRSSPCGIRTAPA